MRWILPLALTTALGSAQQSLVNIDTVLVGDPGNPEMFYNKRGSVPYEFKIGKYEVTIEQYVAFLNSVASVTTNAHLADLWHNGMESDPTVAGISRSGAGSSTDPFVYEPMGMAQRPIAYISWFNAARFCNWLHNGAIHGASTEIGAYTLDGMLSDQWRKPTRNAGARWWLQQEKGVRPII